MFDPSAGEEASSVEIATLLIALSTGAGGVVLRGAALEADRRTLDRAVAEFNSPAAAGEPGWTCEQRMAFWINAYNAFTLRVVVDHYPIRTSWLSFQRGAAFWRVRKVSGWKERHAPLVPAGRPASERGILGLIGKYGPAATAFLEKDVRTARLVEAQVGSLPLVLVAPAKDLPVAVFDRRLDGKTLSFRLPDGDPRVMVDSETGSRWSLADGTAVDGPLKGRQLARAPAYPAYWFGWQGYFPRTEVWTRR